MSRSDLIRLAQNITGGPVQSKKKNGRYRATQEAISPSASKGSDIDVIIEQYKASKSMNDDVLSDSIMEQIYFLAFRDASIL